MAKKGLGSGGRLVFLLLGIGLLAVTAVFWLNYLVKPGRAMLNGEKLTVTVTRCEGEKRASCFAEWGGKVPGSGPLSGEGTPGQRVSAYVYERHAYGASRKDWTGRVVLGLVGLGFAVVARYLLGTAVATRR
ncbi:MAG TPA: hypothetical protein VLJ59_11340 [Mycobacteriales bacterium]|nr:hypothetical protein [Mycobacteriales bacterium]